jgi:hypothetical protein
MRNWFVKAAGACLLVLAGAPASAVIVEVNWSADIPDGGVGAPGPGSIMGTLGVFDVSAPGDTFLLPSDGTLMGTTTGFGEGFPNQTFNFTRTFSQGAPVLEFLTIGPTAADFSVNFQDNNTGLNSPFPDPCIFEGVAQNCFITLFDENTSGIDKAGAIVSILNTSIGISDAPVVYSFEVSSTNVPAPSPLVLVTIGLVGVAARSERRRRSGNR